MRPIVTVPPPQVINASKPEHGDNRDWEERLWLIAVYATTAHDVSRAIEALPAASHDKAINNLGLLMIVR